MKISEISTVDILSAYNISPVRFSDSGGVSSYKCPLHNEKNGQSFVVFPDGHWYCFGKCNTGGDAIRFVKLKEDVTYETAVRIAENLLNVRLEYDMNRRKYDKLYKTNETLCQMFQEELKKHPEIIRYLKNERGYTDESIRYWRIGYATRELLLENPDLYEDYEKVGVFKLNGGQYVPLFNNRITYPITDFNNEIVAFSARIDPFLPENIKKSTGKYINSATSAIFSKKHLLFGLGGKWRELVKKDKFSYLVEGAPDATILQQENIAALGLLGLGSNDIGALQTLAIRYPDITWHLCLDGDDAGYERAFKLSVNSLLAFIEKYPQVVIKISFLPRGIDPDEYVLKYKKSGFIQNIHQSEQTMSVEDFVAQKIINSVNEQPTLSEKRGLLFSQKGYKKALLAFPKQLRYAYWKMIEEKTSVKITEFLEEIENKRKNFQVEKNRKDLSNGSSFSKEKFFQDNYPILYIVKNSQELTNNLNQILEKYSFDKISAFEKSSFEVSDVKAFWKHNLRSIIDDYYAFFMSKKGNESAADKFVFLYSDLFGKQK